MEPLDKIFKKLSEGKGMDETHLSKILENERDWRLHLLGEITSIKGKHGDIAKEIAQLQVKAGVWGLMGGGVPVIITLGLYLLKAEGFLK